MNERIQALVKQAGDYVNEVYTPPVRSKTPGKIWEDGHIDWHTQFNKKFAELIIQECMDIISNQTTLDMNEDFREGFSHGRKLAWTEIKKRFGVKE